MDSSARQSSIAPPTIAAIIVNYNYAHYISDAIVSVLSQQPPFDEVIVVDDGSTDHSLEVISAYGDRVKLVAKQRGGQLTASIAGINQAKSDYVYILDADDYALDGLVKAVLPILTSRPVKAQFQLMGVDKDKHPLGSVFPTYGDGYDDAAMRDDNCIVGFYTTPPTSGNVYRREVLAGLDLGSLPGNDPVDGAPNLGMPYLGRVVSVDVPVACYRIHGSNLWSGFASPDCAYLDWEIESLHQRWRAVCHLIGLHQPPFGNGEPLAIRQLKLMKAGIDDGDNVMSVAWRFITQLPKAHFTRMHKIALSLWAVALLFPSCKLRRKLVFARRSPINRPRLLQKCVRALSGRTCVFQNGRELRSSSAVASPMTDAD